MKPVDFRNENWEQVRGRMNAARAVVYRGMLDVAPIALTTRDWAEVLRMDVLSVRPRITELVQMCYVVCEGEGREGKYRALSSFEARRAFEETQRLAREPQLEMDWP